MNKKRVYVVSATEARTFDEWNQKPIVKSLEKQTSLRSPKEFDFCIIRDNKRGLSDLYNEYLNKKEHQKDILLFVHDDVELEDIFLVEKLLNSPYEVTGLAGAKSIDLSKTPAWHLMSDKNTHVGEVAHTSQGQVWTSVFGPTNSRALVLDGLFLAVDVEVVTTKGAKFDEDFKFHHYDIAFCLDCNAKKIKMGVLPIRVVHHGLGDSMRTQDWIDNAKRFTQKFGTKTN
jgi:hypothetical protein